MARIAINGLGRIGRHVFRRIFKHHPELKIVAINDLTPPEVLTHLLKYDSLYGYYEQKIKFKDDSLLVDGLDQGRKVLVFQEKNPANLPWKELMVDVVLECTGVFRDYDGAAKHLKAGAKKVIISAPSKDPDKVPTFILGVNAKEFDPEKYDIVDMGSCTTNCAAPVAKVLNDEIGIEKAFLTAVHSYTSSQQLLDGPSKDLRRARAAALNIVPSTTGAASAVEKCLPELKGRLEALSLRVPTPVVSIIDFVGQLKKESSREEINFILRRASKKQELKGILGVEDALLVSSDYKGNSYSAVVDSDSTRCQGNLVKILAWYDNEFAYACRLAEFCSLVAGRL